MYIYIILQTWRKQVPPDVAQNIFAIKLQTSVLSGTVVTTVVATTPVYF